MEKQGYDKGTAVGVTAASSTLGSIIPPSITMVVYAGIANVGTGALFMTGLIPGIMLGLAMMLVIVLYSKKKNFPKGEKVPTKEVLKQIWTSLPALLTPIILIGGIVSGLFTPTESAAVACVYALIIGIFFYHTIKISRIPAILIETMKLSSLSLFALAAAKALSLVGEGNPLRRFLRLLGESSLEIYLFNVIFVLEYGFFSSFLDIGRGRLFYYAVTTLLDMGLGVLLHRLLAPMTAALLKRIKEQQSPGL